MIHEAADASVAVWLARAGRFITTSSTYGAGRTLVGGGVRLTTARSTLWGSYRVTARLVPDSSTAVSSTADFGSGARALKVEIRGDLP